MIHAGDERHRSVAPRLEQGRRKDRHRCEERKGSRPQPLPQRVRDMLGHPLEGRGYGEGKGDAGQRIHLRSDAQGVIPSLLEQLAPRKVEQVAEHENLGKPSHLMPNEHRPA